MVGVDINLNTAAFVLRPVYIHILLLLFNLKHCRKSTNLRNAYINQSTCTCTLYSTPIPISYLTDIITMADTTEQQQPNLVDDSPISPVERRNSLEAHLKHRPERAELVESE